ncbi:hypothetical protein [Amycolatopsis sp. NPDC051903]|uniref:hypothetical protein n=1 Tax=Amycolatopsis sp. NPDC051903 TaxID=3363936 RepID=UPI0037898787
MITGSHHRRGLVQVARYSIPLVQRVQGLIEELSQLKEQKISTARNTRIQQVEREILKLTGAPSVAAAKVSVNSYFKALTPKTTKVGRRKAKRDLEAAAKRKKVKKEAVDPPTPPPAIRVVSGGLPGTRR